MSQNQHNVEIPNNNRNMVLPFIVGSKAFALPYNQVTRVNLVVGVVAVANYNNFPLCVVGVAAGEPEMLTVLDLGFLYGSGRTISTMKTRLMIMSDGALKGFALLVSRVLDPLVMSNDPNDMEIQVIRADEIYRDLIEFAKTNECK